ncbi:MAG: efflux RND transporter periplasmic adaptor subunit [Chloroflexi bacterium]|nr:efflux RND transporter periplasmic adaptor subunit [Chloroflexota bacterium]
MEKKSRKSGKKWILFAAIAVVVVAAAVFVVIPRLQALRNGNGATTYQTQPLGRGDLTAYVGATGNVRTNQTATLNWQAEGIVGKVNVTKGQVVDKDTVLAELDPASLPQNVINAQTDLATAQKALDDLLNSTTARANAELALISAERDLQTAQQTAQSKQFQRASQTTINVAQANLLQAQSALDKATEIYNQNKNRSTSDMQYAAALTQFANAQQKYDQAQANLNYVTGLPDALDVQKANADLDLAQATYLDAKRAWEDVKDGPNPADVAAAEAKVASAQAILDTAYIKAPFSGTIMEIDTRPGDLVSSQTVAFEIDDISHLYTDIQVSEVDINSVQVGQPVDITLDAIPDKTYPGKVTDVGSVGVISSGVVNFNVTVEINAKDPQIKPGMTTSANIATVQVRNELVVPTRAIRDLNGVQIVYVLQNGALRPVPITTGVTSTVNSQLLSGNLQEGEPIVLNPPSNPASATGSRGILGGMFGGGGNRVPAEGGGIRIQTGGGNTGGSGRTP